MSAIPQTMTAAHFFGTTNLLEQLHAIATSDGWQIPAHLTVEVAARAHTRLQDLEK